jgi:hypothetical protein
MSQPKTQNIRSAAESFLIFMMGILSPQGFGDQAYINRRAELNALANSYHYGEPIPMVNYTEEEHVSTKLINFGLHEK